MGKKSKAKKARQSHNAAVAVVEPAPAVEALEQPAVAVNGHQDRKEEENVTPASESKALDELVSDPMQTSTEDDVDSGSEDEEEDAAAMLPVKDSDSVHSDEEADQRTKETIRDNAVAMDPHVEDFVQPQTPPTAQDFLSDAISSPIVAETGKDRITAIQESASAKKDDEVCGNDSHARQTDTAETDADSHDEEDEEQDAEDDEEEEDESEDEEDDEPTLKYARLGAASNEIVVKDTASALATSSRYIALGTHNGMVHILTYEGSKINSYRPHAASVTDIKVDEESDFVATASMEGEPCLLSAYGTNI